MIIDIIMIIISCVNWCISTGVYAKSHIEACAHCVAPNKETAFDLSIYCCSFPGDNPTGGDSVHFPTSVYHQFDTGNNDVTLIGDHSGVVTDDRKILDPAEHCPHIVKVGMSFVQKSDPSIRSTFYGTGFLVRDHESSDRCMVVTAAHCLLQPGCRLVRWNMSCIWRILFCEAKMCISKTNDTLFVQKSDPSIRSTFYSTEF